MRLIARALPALALVSFFLPITNCRSDATSIEDQIKQAEEEMRQAFVHADVVALDHLLADDWRVVHVNGREQTKAQFLDALRTGRAKFLSCEIDQPEVRVYGDTAVLIARWTNTIEFKGQRTAGHDRVAQVWVKQAQGWRDVSDHAAYLPEPNDNTTTAGDQQENLRLTKTIEDAWLRHDVDAVSPLIADDFQSWSFKGARRGKTDLLKHVAQNNETATQVEDPQVRVFADTAIYTARIIDSGKDDHGNPFNTTSVVTSVFARRDGKWQMIQDHETIVTK